MGKLWTEHKLWQILNAPAVQYAKCSGLSGAKHLHANYAGVMGSPGANGVSKCLCGLR